MLSDARAAMQTFDDYQAFRFSKAALASAEPTNVLLWDPPTGAAWDEATHVARGLHGRAEQLFQAVTTSKPDPEAWRARRQLADSVHLLMDLGGTLAAYRRRVDVVGSQGDGSGGLGTLEDAWRQWDDAAQRWGVSRAEQIGCGA